MTGNTLSLGQAIDQILDALSPLEDGARRTALAAACMQLGIPSSTVIRQHEQGSATFTPAITEPAEGVSPIDPARSVLPQVMHHIDIRTFKEQKNPASARQMACLVAFYLQELTHDRERKESVNAHDLEKYFKQAGYKLPAKMSQILVDVKNAGYADSVSRGEYKLNAVGYNLVAHNMPTGAE